jgi:hypothetical protein
MGIMDLLQYFPNSVSTLLGSPQIARSKLGIPSLGAAPHDKKMDMDVTQQMSPTSELMLHDHSDIELDLQILIP